MADMMPATPKPLTVAVNDPAFDVKAVAPRFSINWDQLKSWVSGSLKDAVQLAIVGLLGGVLLYLNGLTPQIPLDAFWGPIALALVALAKSGIGLAMKYFGGPSKESLMQESPVFARQATLEAAEKK